MNQPHKTTPEAFDPVDLSTSKETFEDEVWIWNWVQLKEKHKECSVDDLQGFVEVLEEYKIDSANSWDEKWKKEQKLGLSFSQFVARIQARAAAMHQEARAMRFVLTKRVDIEKEEKALLKNLLMRMEALKGERFGRE